MKEGRPYPKQEEEGGNCLTACEPAVALAERNTWVNTDAPLYKEIMSADCRCPHTLEELEAEIDYAESVENDPTEWIPSEQMWEEIRELFPWAKFE
ncbi:MAG: hypothetical protein IKR50_01960 [Prevotella sp.]|nr:hypothetical protein [Prevotella sp.]